MIEFLRSWIFNIAALVIFIVLLEILLPSGRMKKFINLISGFVLIIAIINPFLGLVKNGIDLKEFQLSKSNFLDKQDIASSSKLMQEKQMQQVVEVYRKKLINRLEEGLKDDKNAEGIKADVLIDEDYTSKNFGEIKRVYLTVPSSGKTSDIKQVTKVSRIQIGDIKKQQETKKNDAGNEIDKELKNRLEEKVNKLLDVKKENIVINLQKS